jgi:hypothetical protein
MRERILRQLDLSTAPSFVGPSLVVIAIFGSILVLIERSNMKEMNTIYEELISLIEKEISDSR